MAVQYKLYEGADTIVKALQYRYRDWEGGKQLVGTDDRLFRLFEEFCWKPEKIDRELKKVFKVFDHEFHQMIVGGPWLVHVLCPHHLAPCTFHVYTGYIPNKDRGKVLGLSKLARVADIVGRRPIIQEQYTEELADVLEQGLANGVSGSKPEGVAVYVVGVHGCMTSRGVRQQGEVTTSVVRGAFLTEAATRNEFYMIARDGR